jgi:hypothetical protein
VLGRIRAFWRSSAAVLGFAFCLHAQDAAEIVRRSIATEDRTIEFSRNYGYEQRQEIRETDSNGSLRKTGSDTYEILILEGSPFRRHTAHDDKPLSKSEGAKEDEKYRHAAEDRRKETAEQRQARIGDWDRRRRRQREPYRQVPDAFNLKVAGEETINSIPAWVIEATPKPGFKPSSNATRFFPKVKGRIWISKADYQVLKLDVESLDTISFGGFLVRMAKGSHIVIDAEHVNNEVWLPTRAVLRGSVRIALIKVIRGEVIFTFGKYKKAAPATSAPLP